MSFDESKVNRDELGRFAEKSTSELRKSQIIEIEDDNKVEVKSTKPKAKSKEEFFGKEHKGVKGMAAVEKLLQEQNGHVKAAFYRKEVGDIDLPWGDDGGGLAHVIKRRDEYKVKGKGAIAGLEMAKKIPDIVEKGEFDIDALGRPGFIYDGCRVAIRPNYDGENLTWLVSAMEIIKNNPLGD